MQEGVFTEDIVDRFWLAFSNPRSTEGAFFECFHKDRKFWRTTQLDSRTVEGVSQATYSNIIEKYGEDSDEARVEVYGQFPKSSQDQFISPALVDEAIAREKQDDDSAPIVIGADPARWHGLDGDFGKEGSERVVDQAVFRRGSDDDLRTGDRRD